MSKVKFIDYYQLLGLGPSATKAQIRQAFIAHAKQHHPDIGGSSDRMQQLNTAYKTLIGGESKAAYDLLHSFHTGTTQPQDYKYEGGREVSEVTDMTDSEIDSFLNSLLNEYRDGPATTKRTIKERIKKFFEV